MLTEFHRRCELTDHADANAAELLGASIEFPTAGRTAQNRFFKTPATINPAPFSVRRDPTARRSRLLVDPIPLIHKRESTKQREAFFLECSAAIKPELKRTVLFLTGGFRTLPAMWKALERNEVDGIGIGRPAAAEPDLPAKILDGRVRSCVYNHFDQDFGTSMLQGQTQMRQMGATKWAECNDDPCFGISDFSRLKEAENFESGVMLHMLSAIKSELIFRTPFDQHFDYDPAKKYDSWLARFTKYVVGAFSKFNGFKV
ncbi:Oxidored-FMN domain-containing protein [Aphelenchoides fujianensis]|nr:Oxidored-FMN domain-containing protein [Aphelenchoides fujianensis]